MGDSAFRAMLMRLLLLFFLTLSFAEESPGQPELALEGLAAEEVCEGTQEDCAALSLRQLRSKQLTDLQDSSQHSDKGARKDTAKDTAQDTAHRGAHKVEANNDDSEDSFKSRGKDTVQHTVQDTVRDKVARTDANRSRSDPACSRWTGGTCLLGKCDSSRGAGCSKGICYCGEGMCAKEGKCEKDTGGGGAADFGKFMKCESKLEQHCIYGCNDDNAACSWGTCHCKEGFCNFGGKCIQNFMSQWMPSSKETPASEST